MKKPFALAFLLLIIPPGSLLLAAGCQGSARSAQSDPVARVILAPTPLPTDDAKLQLVYEMHIQGWNRAQWSLERIEALPDEGASALATFADSAIEAIVFDHVFEWDAVGTGHAHHLDREEGDEAVAYLTFEVSGDVPVFLRHRLVFRSASEEVDSLVVESAPVRVRKVAPDVLGPPLREGPWVAGNVPSPIPTPHRLSLARGGDGELKLSNRYAIDFFRIDANGRDKTGEGDRNADFLAFGAEVLAVEDGVAVEAVDGIPDHPPVEDWRTLPPPTLDSIGGNHVILDIGDRYVYYAHLRNGSVRVRTGEQVRRGQILAEAGNSGNSTIPHLHFHVTDRFDPALGPNAGQGRAFVFDAYQLLGRCADGAFGEGCSLGVGTQRSEVFPGSYSILSF